MALRPLPLESCIGFGGTVPGSFLLSPDKSLLIYPLGTTIVLRNRSNMRAQEFLQGHDNRVSVVACSRSGKYLASGQLSHQGFSAAIIIWDLPGRKKLHEMTLHKVKVQALDFSCDDEYLISTGGQDDCKIVAWRVSTGVAICGSPVPYDYATAVKFFNKDPHRFITAGNMKLVVWKLDVPNRILEPESCDVGRLRRIHTSVAIDARDEFMYAATHTGDVLRVSLGPKLLRNGGPKPIIKQGIMTICSTQHGHMLAGGGDGSLTLLENETLRILEQTQLAGAVSSVFLAETAGNSFACYAGTNMSNIYLIKYDGRKQKFMPPEVIQSCHYNKINDIAFPADYSEVFATASTNDVRIWNIKTLKELLRIQNAETIVFSDPREQQLKLLPRLRGHLAEFLQHGSLKRLSMLYLFTCVGFGVPNEWCDYKDSANQECLSVTFMPDGKSIITGWSDGKIRAFGPQTGKLQYTIVDAHSTAGKGKAFQGVTALCPTTDSCRIVSGGIEGRVRVWRVGNQSHSLIASMKEHRGAVTGIHVRKNNSECITCSSDGSCVIWDLSRYARNNSFYASTFFKAAMYHPDESQILTTGTDRKITWWDAYDCQPIRILDGSLTSEVYSIDISPDGAGMVSTGVDREVKLWNYDEGHNYFVGLGHSEPVTKVKISPDQQKIISVGEEGAILIWDYKKPVSNSPPEKKDGEDGEDKPERSLCSSPTATVKDKSEKSACSTPMAPSSPQCQPESRCPESVRSKSPSSCQSTASSRTRANKKSTLHIRMKCQKEASSHKECFTPVNTEDCRQIG